jgi:hypothetical protein
LFKYFFIQILCRGCACAVSTIHVQHYRNALRDCPCIVETAHAQSLHKKNKNMPPPSIKPIFGDLETKKRPSNRDLKGVIFILLNQFTWLDKAERLACTH